jgi:hypothetical protein
MGEKMKKKLAALVASIGLAVFAAGCGDNSGNANNGNANTGNRANANNSNSTTGPITTNTNMPSNMNGKTAPSNTAVVTNNNGNANTMGVQTTNTAGGKKGDAKKEGDKANGNMKKP